MNYELIVGLEVHVQASTKSKMFSNIGAGYFGDLPNSHVDAISMGLPGVLPVPNMEAVRKCIALSLALNCQINQDTRFDRKNYFYPDLPKGYQISQYDFPIGYGGYIEIETGGDSKRIRIRRVHMEEDTGKSVHENDHTLLDYNKSGIPLIEIVTEPDFQLPEEVTAFAKLLRQTVIYLGVSEAEMQKGQMRFELNISLRESGKKGLPEYKVEIKNIGSISVLESVLGFEYQRQSAILETGETPVSETRGLRDLTGVTYSQRIKESEADYRYFPEPDIPPIRISDEWLAEIKSQIGELPWQRKSRYIAEFGLEAEQAELLVEQREKGEWMDQLAAKCESSITVMQEATKWFVGEISGQMEKKSCQLRDLPVTHEDLIYLVKEMQANNISGTIVKKVIELLFSEQTTARDIVESRGLKQISDENALTAVVDQVIAENPKLVESLAKNPNALNALLGQVMRATKGQANPHVVEKALRQRLSSHIVATE